MHQLIRKLALPCLFFVLYASAPAAQEFEPDAIEKLVPSDALVFVEIRNIPEISDSFGQTLLSAAIDESEFLDAARDTMYNLARFVTIYATDVPYEEVKRLLGKNIAFVLFDTTDPRAKAPTAILFDVSHCAAEFQQLLQSRIKPKIKTIVGDDKLGTEEIEGTPVEFIQPPKRGRSYFIVKNGVLVIGDREAVARIIKSGAHPMASNPTYTTVAQRSHTRAGLNLFLNMDVYWQQQEEQWMTNPDSKAGAETLGTLNVKAVSASSSFEGSGLRDKLFVYTGVKPSGMLGHLCKQQPQVPRSAALVPPDYTLYLALQAGGGTALFDAFKETMVQTRGDQALFGVEQLRMALLQNTGVDIEQDIIGQVGNEFFIAADLKNAFSGGAFKIMNVPLIVGFDALNQERLEGAISQIIFSDFAIQRGITLDTFKYKDVPVHLINNPRLPQLQFSYTFVDGMMLFSPMVKNIERLLDARDAKTSLSESEDYKAAFTKVSPRSNVLVYLDTGGFVKALAPMLRSKAPAQLRPLAPVLEALTEKLHGLGLTLVAADDGIVGDCYSPIGGPCFFLSAACLGRLRQPLDIRRIADAKKRMAKIQNAIRKYKMQVGTYPATLEELLPTYIKQLPTDPFAKDGASFYFLSSSQLIPAPNARAQAAQQGYIIISIGPDGKLDIDPNKTSYHNLLEKSTSTAPEDVNWLKKLVHKYKPELNPDEREEFDEGDIVVYGQ